MPPNSPLPNPRDTLGELFQAYTVAQPVPSTPPVPSAYTKPTLHNPFEDDPSSARGSLSSRNSFSEVPLIPSVRFADSRNPDTRAGSVVAPSSRPALVSRTSSSSHEPSTSHLRQRSGHRTPTTTVFGTDRDGIEGRNPFNDKFRQPDMKPHAAMFEAPPESSDGHGGMEYATANGMRGDRAEWGPTAQHLYSEQDDAGRSLRTSPTPSGKNSEARYDLAAVSPRVMQGYASARYTKEADDRLHDMGAPGKREGWDRRIMESGSALGSGTIFTWRGVLNLGGIGILVGALLMLFGGYPILSYFTSQKASTFGAVGLGGTNASGQVPAIAGYRGLLDADTPDDVMTRTGFDGKAYQLVFSDEFNTDGRTFYEGEDPYWTAVDLHYWQTQNIEWYDPANIQTKDGYLEISLTKESLADSHDRGYLGGMLQSWNKFCFQGGYIEVAISLPGDTTVKGLWPAAWTMSNLGRAGYGGSLDGNWPFVYEACDVGTLKNQTDPTTGLPDLPKKDGDQYNEYAFSYLEGQRLSACTCPGELHPGPKFDNGSFAGRGASEIDIFEATVSSTGGQISQSGQWAPFNPSYTYINTSTEYVEFFENEYNTIPNTYLGGAYQQVTSALSDTDPTTYNSTTNFMKYGFEYTPSFFEGYGNGKITFSQDAKPMWRISDVAMGPNSVAGVSNRVITGEPMYILFNLGMSPSFGTVDLADIVFPSVMRIDYVRIYQDNDQIRIGCDPADHPTADYIAQMPQAYADPNVTVMADMGLSYPKNSMIDTC